MRRFLLLLISMTAGILPLAAQTTSLQGTVKDKQNALIPTVVVSLTNVDTGAARQILSGSDGTYNFLQMSPGHYKIEAKLPGFSVYSQDIHLQIDTPATVNILLELGQSESSVNVVADVPLLNTQTASMGTPFTQTQIRQLPLQTRNIVDLLGLQAGVSTNGSVAGAKANQNNVTLDGVDVNDSQGAGGAFNSVLSIPLDSVQEFRTTIAGQGADQGRSSGGQVSVITKSGSNSFHGSLYEYNRNTALAANNWFSNRSGTARPKLIRNQYGASLGGPVIKNRVFFFASWEERKDRSDAVITRTVPTDSFKQGIVSVRTNNAGVQSFSPAEVAKIDLIGLGGNPYILNMLQSYPAPNDLTGGDQLNTATLRFNAPNHLDYQTLVAKMDFNLDSQGHHTVSVRGTYMDNAEDGTLAQFPGQSASSKNLENSRGIAASYTAILSPSMINVVNYGLTRLGTQSSGVGGSSVTFSVANLQPFPRASVRISPTHNLVDDFTWVKGKHTMQFGGNFRFLINDRTAYNNFPSYSLSRNTLKGLGNDINLAVTNFLKTRTGSSTIAIPSADQTNVTNAFGTMFGILNNYGGTYQYNIDGTTIPFGNAVPRSFGNNEWEFYGQDTWKVRRDLTLTGGLRYSLFPAPYERNGVQVAPITGVDVFFSERVAANQLGIPGNALAHATMTYEKGGAANGGKPYYKLDTNNFAPRLSLAYAPDVNGQLGQLFGKGSVLRAGFAVTYDRYGGNMAVSFANNGSPGLTYGVSQPLNTDFTDSFRYQGTDLPVLPSAPSGAFPFTPPAVVGGFGTFSSVDPNLVAPYTYLLNATYARPLPGKLTVEVGYIGRLSHKNLLTQDYFQPLTRLLDPKSGTTWAEASGILRDYFESGITPAQVKANPSILPKVPFFENMFPGAGGTIIGTKTAGASPTANYFYSVYSDFARSDLDALNAFDRVKQSNGHCLSVTDCYTFFATQNSGMPTWANADNPVYHGMTLVLRRAISKGVGFDFNYTLSKSLDRSSGGTGDGAGIQDAFNPKDSRSYSTFDARHNINFNSITDLPFGRGKVVLGNASSWLDQIVGGWQLSMIGRYRSGQPTDVSVGGVYPTNYLNSSLGILKQGATLPVAEFQFNTKGNPSLYPLTAANSFYGQYPGQTGSRGILRGPSSRSLDVAMGKTFRLPMEGHTVQVRGEAFNALNLVNFGGLNTTATGSSFGQLGSASDARVIQIALRYEF